LKLLTDFEAYLSFEKPKKKNCFNKKEKLEPEKDY